jgi:hypothetical protein
LEHPVPAVSAVDEEITAEGLRALERREVKRDFLLAVVLITVTLAVAKLLADWGVK